MQINTIKMIRDAGLAATALGLVFSKAMPNAFCSGAAVVAGIALAVCAATRIPETIAELKGFKKVAIRRVGGII